MAGGSALARPDDDPLADLIAKATACLERGETVRCDVPPSGRLHVDRPMPFLCLHVHDGSARAAARDIAAANAAYLIAPDLKTAVAIGNAVGDVMAGRFGGFLVFEIGELEHDILLADDSPYLPHFQVQVEASAEPGAQAAEAAFSKAVCATEALFRTPHITRPDEKDSRLERLQRAGLRHPCLAVRYAPIYRQPESGAPYPALRDRVIGNLSDAALQAFAAFAAKETTLPAPPTHRALGRKAIAETVRRADRSLDAIARSFDFLLAVTPINARQALAAFNESGHDEEPRFLYRPLATDVEAEKRRLYSVGFDHLEDPVLYRLYREKQQELDLQLTLLKARNTPAFKAFGLALYGAVGDDLQAEARAILAQCNAAPDAQPQPLADAYEVADRARAMAAFYRGAFDDFRVRVEIRDDLPPGLMVTGDTLLVARTTVMERRRIEALLAHEIGVHLLTYFNGSAQGLRVFRTGLAGYEGVQEGLAVLAEYLAGGMTRERLRLLAGRVLACAAMLDGAGFVETFRFLTDSGGFDTNAAFGIALRVHRGGGLAKDAIYLRGLAQVRAHLARGGSLDPFWMGKMSAAHFPVMQELASRGLLTLARVRPDFLAAPQAKERLAAIAAGLPVSAMATL